MSAKYDVAGIISFLQEQPDINPDSYDGSYELLRETVKSYAIVRDTGSDPLTEISHKISIFEEKGVAEKLKNRLYILLTKQN